jgi:hypothetical protein
MCFSIAILSDIFIRKRAWQQSSSFVFLFFDQIISDKCGRLSERTTWRLGDIGCGIKNNNLPGWNTSCSA